MSGAANARPLRVIALLPAASEIVAALGAVESLVGVTHECDHPPSLAMRPRVTSSAIPAQGDARAIDDAVRSRSSADSPLFTLDEAHIAALRPDIILTQALCAVCAVSEGDVRALARRLEPEPHVVTLSGTSIEGVIEDIVRVATAIGCSDEGLELVAGLRARMRRVHDTLKAALAPRPRVAVIEWTSPLYAAGHWVPELIDRAGGRDVIATARAHSTIVDIERVRAADPEVIIIAPCGFGIVPAANEGSALLSRPEWNWARDRSVWAVDANALVSRPGPRLIEGLEIFAGILHPTRFPAPAPRQAFPLAVPVRA